MLRTILSIALFGVLVLPAAAAIDIKPLPDPHADDQILLGPTVIGGVAKILRRFEYPGYTEQVNATKPLAGFGGHFDYQFGSMFYKTQLYGGVIFTSSEIIYGMWENYYGICFAAGKFRPYVMPGAGLKVSGDEYSTTTSFVGSLLFGILFRPNPAFAMVLDGGYKGVTNDASYGVVRNIYDFRLSDTFGLHCGFEMESELSRYSGTLEARVYLGPNFYF